MFFFKKNQRMIQLFTGSLQHLPREWAIQQKLKEEIKHKKELCKHAYKYRNNWIWLNKIPVC